MPRCASIAALMFASAAAAQTPGFWLTGLPAGGSSGVVRGLSQNGAVAVGFAAVQPAHPGAGFSWTRQGGRDDWGFAPGMPSYSPAFAVDSAGQTVVGWAGEKYPADRAFRRVGNGPLQDLGILAGQTRSWASGVNGNGGIVVGASEHTIPAGPFSFDGGEAFRWTESGGMQGLGYLRPNGVHSRALGISRDGSTIVGSSKSGSVLGDVEAYRWTEAGGMQLLPLLPGALANSAEAVAASADGSIIIGTSDSSTGFDHAVRWTPTGIEDLALSLPNNHSRAYALSDDGNVVGGTYQSGGLLFAFAWTPTTGLIDLSAFLQAHAVTIPADYRLEGLYAISGDGLTFAGQAVNLSTNIREGFVATIPSPATLVVVLGSPLALRRRRA